MFMGGITVTCLVSLLVVAVAVILPEAVAHYNQHAARRALESIKMWNTVHQIAIRARKRNQVSGITFSEKVLLEAEARLIEQEKNQHSR